MLQSIWFWTYTILAFIVSVVFLEVLNVALSERDWFFYSCYSLLYPSCIFAIGYFCGCRFFFAETSPTRIFHFVVFGLVYFMLSFWILISDSIGFIWLPFSLIAWGICIWSFSFEAFSKRLSSYCLRFLLMGILFHSPLITIFYVLVTSVDDTELAEQQRLQDSVKETVNLSAELINKNLELQKKERDNSLLDIVESIYILDEEKRVENYSGKRSADLSALLKDVGKNRSLIEDWFSTENLSVYSSPFLLFAIREYEEQLLNIDILKDRKSTQPSLPISLERLRNKLQFSLTGQAPENHFILDLGDIHVCLSAETVIFKISGIQNRYLKLRYGVVPQSEWGQRVTSLEGLVYLCHTSQSSIQSSGTSYQLSIFCLGWISILIFVMLIYSSYRDRITREKLDVASTVAHEFRTPIAGAAVLIDNLLADQDIKSEKVNSYLEKMKLANQKLHQIAEHFFIEGALKQKNIKLETVNLSEWVDEQWEEFKLIHLSDNVLFISSVSRADETILMDKVLLSLALQNILRNAYQYTKKGSVTISLAEKINQLGIEVKDTGIGMDTYTAKNVLKKYKRGEDLLSRETEGLGLGLYLAQEIAKLHAGEIKIVSSVGEGSTFTLWISK